MQVTVRGHSVGYDLEGSGPPLLLLMGFGMQRVAWRHQVAGLKSDFTVCAFDNRGVGESTAGRLRVGLGELAADAVGLMDALGWESAHVVGVSMGGMTAQHLALTHRARVRSLSLIATHAGGGLFRTTPRLQALRLFFRANQAKGAARLDVLRELLYPPGMAPLEEGSFDAIAEPTGGRTRLTQLASILRHDTRSQLRQLEGLPTLVIRPDDDILVPPHCSDALARAIPGARLVSVPHAGHGVTAQMPDLVNSLIREHALAAERRR